MWKERLEEELLRENGGRFRSWQLRRRVGSGFSSVVFDAEDTKGERVALKIYNPEFAVEDAKKDKNHHYKRLLRQRKLIDHGCPYLVRIREPGKWHHTATNTTYYFLSMDLVDGFVLSDYQHHPPKERVAPLVAQIANAVEFLEDRGIVHRDIKPSNIAITKDYRRAVLLDTGVIGDIDKASPHTGTDSEPDFKGTFAYSPPEYIEGEHEQTVEGWRAISLFQLGAVIYELLFNRPIYTSSGNRYRIHRMKSTSPPDFPDLPYHSPAANRLRSLALRCLDPEPEERLKIKWSDFSCIRDRKEPTVVFLYAGGTIGSNKDDDLGHAVNEVEGPNNEYLQEMSRRVSKEYSLTFQNGGDPPFKVEWRTLPKEYQVLSENSTSRNLTALADGVSDILCEFHGETEEPARTDRSNRYLAGIVVLHGTDTLAYSASALHFVFPRLPCPVILTGSNIPPDHRDSPLEASLTSPRSDAWKNLSRSLHFLASLGHRICEVFVFFAATVLHPLNVKKLLTSSEPLREEIATRLASEPFIFRNRSTFRSMAFKFIDGAFCNNFYPIAGASDFTLRRLTGTDPGADSSSPHSRSWPEQVFNKPKYSFEDSVLHHKATPGQPLIRMEGCKILLLEGFASGTFASEEHHRFRHTLLELARRSIPLVVVSPDGIFPMQEQYKTEPLEDGEPFPHITLYRTIAPTALPLLSLIAGEISDQEWTPTGRPNISWRALLEHRNRILKKRIAERIRQTVLASAILGNITNQSDQAAHVQLFRSSEDSIFRRTAEKLFRFGSRSEQLVSLRDSLNRDPGNLSMRKADFLGLLYLAAQPYSGMGSMPDMFATLSFSGFTWVHEVTKSIAEESIPTSGKLLSRSSEGESKTRIESAKKLVTFTGKVLRLYGWDIGNFHLWISEDLRSYKIYAEVKGDRMLQRDDELYGVYNWKSRDNQFFQMINIGIPLEEGDKYFSELIRNLYDHDFARQFSPLEWIIVGMLRSLSGKVGQILRIDQWTLECIKSGAFELLRTSCEIKATSRYKNRMELELEYVARGDSERTNKAQIRETQDQQELSYR